MKIGTTPSIKNILAPALSVVAGLALHANATTVISLVGDKDGFGLAGAPAVPADGTLWRDGLGGVFGNDYRDAGDLASAPFTDKWSADRAVAYNHSYSLAGLTPVSASLAIQFAGVADNRGPWDVKVNGTLVGQVPLSSAPNAFQEIYLRAFVVPIGLLAQTDAILLDINVPFVTDGYSINFSELTIETQPSTPIPDAGSTVGMLGLALGFLLPCRRREA